ncbi:MULTISPECIES: hypothetical protein [Levilactobacillus]|uniref:hypothetical protein n=1 Tax=Levilactobacillus TaxID=2767886 RepID=UPI00194FE788|nr:hypothetical protein [Levilactobacillus sp. 244-2]
MWGLEREKRVCSFLFSWFLLLPATSWLLTYPRQSAVDLTAEGLAILWGLLVLGWSCRPQHQA